MSPVETYIRQLEADVTELRAEVCRLVAARDAEAQERDELAALIEVLREPRGPRRAAASATSQLLAGAA